MGTGCGVAGTTVGFTLGPQATLRLENPAFDPSEGRSFKEGSWDSADVGGVSSNFDMFNRAVGE